MNPITNKVYAPHVSAQEMSIDGWSRGFDVEQTLEEMTNMGVDITKEQIELHWARLTKGMPYNVDNNATTISTFASLNKQEGNNDIYSQLTKHATDTSKYVPVEGSSCHECGSVLDVGEVECSGMFGVCTTCYFDILSKE